MRTHWREDDTPLPVAQNDKMESQGWIAEGYAYEAENARRGFRGFKLLKTFPRSQKYGSNRNQQHLSSPSQGRTMTITMKMNDNGSESRLLHCFLTFLKFRLAITGLVWNVPVNTSQKEATVYLTKRPYLREC